MQTPRVQINSHTANKLLIYFVQQKKAHLTFEAEQNIDKKRREGPLSMLNELRDVEE